MNEKEAEYRIVSDNFNGYECQKKIKYWLWGSCWVQLGRDGNEGVSTHESLEDAKAIIEKAKILPYYIK